MFGMILKTLIIYIAVAFSVRLMGKRQLGELQPGELVVTILISEIAAAPIQDSSIPLVHGLIPLLLLVSFEILSSVISMKSVRFRFISEGNPVTVIRNGELLQNQLKRLRLTVNDVLSALRQKDVFNLDDVDYAVLETNGSLSVLLKPEKLPMTYEPIEKQENNLTYPIVIDGRIIKSAFEDSGITVPELEKIFKREHLLEKDILLMTIDKKKNYKFIVKKENSL